VDYGPAYTGGTSDDTFNATATSTFTPLDALDGGAGTDTLNVYDNAASINTAGISVANIENANLASTAAVIANTSNWTGLLKLNIAIDKGNSEIAAATTTSVAVAAHSGGSLEVSGGSSQTVNATGGDTTLSGSIGPIALVQTAQEGNALTVDGGSSVKVTATGATASTAEVAVGGSVRPTGAVVVTRTEDPTEGSHTAGTITVTGGTSVNVTQNLTGLLNATNTAGAVAVNGSDNTTTVSIVASKAATASGSVAGVTNGAVAINDVNAGDASKAGTISSVTVDGFSTVSFSGTALTNLSLSNGSGNIIIDNSGLTTPTNKTLGVTVNNLAGATLDDADIYTTLNITAASASTLANITFGGLTSLNVDGAKVLTLTSATGMGSLSTVKVSGSAGLVADLSGATLTSVDTSAASGVSTITLDATKATYTGGVGADIVTLAGNVSKAISLGGGEDKITLGSGTATAAITGGTGSDTLSIEASAAATASASAAFAGLVSGFETLLLTGATNQTVDLKALGGYTGATTTGGNGLTLTNLPSTGALKLTGAGTAYTVSNDLFTVPTDDVLNVALTDGSGSGVSFASSGVTATNVETVNITTADTQATPSGSFTDDFTLLGNSVSKITVGGNAGLILTAESTALTVVDASGIAAAGITPGFSWASGILAAASTVKGSATGTNTVDLTLSVAAATTYTGGTGDDTVVVTNSKNNILTLGAGSNSVNATTAAGTGNNTVTAGAGADTVQFVSGNNTVDLGAGTNTFVVSTGNNSYTGGAGIDTVNATTGKNTITTGAGNDVVTVGVYDDGAGEAGDVGVNTIDIGTGTDTVSILGNSASALTFTTVTGFGVGDTLQIGNASIGVATFNAAAGADLGSLAVFTDYVNAASSGGSASASNIAWFQYGGNTYVVVDNSDAASFQEGLDSVVKLTGLITVNGFATAADVDNLSTGSQAGVGFTFA